jgi:hypothetical protein
LAVNLYVGRQDRHKGDGQLEISTPQLGLVPVNPPWFSVEPMTFSLHQTTITAWLVGRGNGKI